LFEILSYVIPDPFLHPREWARVIRLYPGGPFVSTFEAVRSTSRRFRSIAEQLPWWYTEWFRFDLLLPPNLHAKMAVFLKFLLLSDQVRSHLQQKASWAINPEQLGVLKQSMGRGENKDWVKRVNTLFLESMNHPVPGMTCGSMVPWLGKTSPHLRTLVCSSKEHVHIDVFPETLQVLFLRAPFDNCLCHLRLKNMRELRFVDTTNSNNKVVHGLDQIIPLDCKDRLKRFDVSYPFTSPWNHYRQTHAGHLLPRSCGLEELTLDPITTETIQVLHRGSMRLKKFKVRTIRPHSAHLQLLELFSTPVLHFQSVRIFEYKIRMPRFTEKTARSFEPFVKAIANLAELEELRIQCPLRVRWCGYFAAATKLRKIEWTAIYRLKSFVTAMEQMTYGISVERAMCKALRNALSLHAASVQVRPLFREKVASKDDDFSGKHDKHDGAGFDWDDFNEEEEQMETYMVGDVDMLTWRGSGKLGNPEPQADFDEWGVSAWEG
jgi:hypothetical protein